MGGTHPGSGTYPPVTVRVVREKGQCFQDDLLRFSSNMITIHNVHCHQPGMSSWIDSQCFRPWETVARMDVVSRFQTPVCIRRYRSPKY